MKAYVINLPGQNFMVFKTNYNDLVVVKEVNGYWKGWTRAPEGIHRAQAANGLVTIGKKVELDAEIAHLKKLLDKPATTARTKSPGVKGFVHRENMSNASIKARRKANELFLDFFKKLKRRIK